MTWYKITFEATYETSVNVKPEDVKKYSKFTEVQIAQLKARNELDPDVDWDFKDGRQLTAEEVKEEELED